ncbi:MAG TPA: hypothetical protein VNL72_01260 [Gammaproteobacteria bacterium]|nr:hypothetical protein [Gammaproteobacteria bacterium]
MKNRRSFYDVTNTVDVRNPLEVLDAVYRIFKRLYPRAPFRPVRQAFDDFTRLYRGQYPNYHACDTPYHDIQHSLDVTLALMRLIDGHERVQPRALRLGARRATTGLVTSLFHDCGYIRHRRDTRHHNGAEFTLNHVERSARFLMRYLPEIDMEEEVAIARKLVHFTGFERDVSRIRLEDPRYQKLGHLVGTADLIAQMADRCYVEKCHDFLYEEFRIGGATRERRPDGSFKILYRSAKDLLRKTPAFYENVVRHRLEVIFERAYEYAGHHFGGRNHYMEELQRNLRFLRRIIDTGRWDLLRRVPVAIY